MAEEAVNCPFCGFRDDDGYAVQLHIEEHHTEDSPFVINGGRPDSRSKARSLPHAPVRISKSSSSSGGPSQENPWVKCTRPGCGEYVYIAEIQEHLDLHEAAAISENEGKKSTRSRMSYQTSAPIRSSRKAKSASSSANDTPNESSRRSPASSQESLSMSTRKRSSSSAEAGVAPSSRSPRKPPRPSNQSAVTSSPQKLLRTRQPGMNNSSHNSQFGKTILEYFAGT